MKAYLIKYRHLNDDATYSVWKIASSHSDAFKFAFGKSPKRNEKIIKNKRGLSIEVLDTEEHEVSDVFPISPIPRDECTKEVSDHGDWML